ncbi:biotin carboxylase [Catenulispora sp. GP43]|uniref:ATP-grasp domain-containing protein n=1 Tax=Catenulispora sp. GP43 TaxID=3156263 RepID=UPI0035132A34
MPRDILVLQRPHSLAPYDRWIREAAPDARVTVLTSRGAARAGEPAAAGVRRIEVDSDYESPAVTAELFRLCAQDSFDRVFANSEDDVLRAAEARTLFGIPGQQSSAALGFRDKVVMKSLFQDPQVPCVPYRPVACLADVLDALEVFGETVLKPRDGAGSVGVRILTDRASVTALFTAEPALLSELHAGRLMAEKYIEGAVYHVDVIVDGSDAVLVSPSRYSCPPHLFGVDNLGSVMLDAGSAVADTLTAAARRFVRRLPAEHGVCVLHLEYLEDATGALFAGEVACRIGGALVKNAIRFTYGVDISRLACLLSLGLVRIGSPIQPVAERTGWLLWTAGPALAAPDGDPAWLVEAAHTPRDGRAASSVDARASFLVRGRDEAEILSHFAALRS